MFNHYLRNYNFYKNPLSTQTGQLPVDAILIRNCLGVNGKDGILTLQAQLTCSSPLSSAYISRKNATYHSLISTLHFLNQQFIGQ